MEVEKTVPRAKATRIISEVIRQATADLMPQIVSFGIPYFQVLIGISPVSDLNREQSPVLFITLCFLGSKYIVRQPVFGGIKLGRGYTPINQTVPSTAWLLRPRSSVSRKPRRD